MSALKNGKGSLRSAAGEVLMVGLEAPVLTSMETAWLKLIRPGGIILFRRNIESTAGVHGLVEAAQQAAGADAPALLRSIDVEGGTVDRLRDLLAPMPSAFAVAASGDSALFTTHGRLIGAELRLLNLNTTFAPVLDLRTPLSESVLTSRAASDKPEKVTRYAQSFLEGLAEEGVLGCGKHFPGLGSGSVDSHRTTPEIGKSFELLWKQDLLPYRRLARQLPMAMISHAAYPLTPSGSEPASLSAFWTTKILTKKLRFRGLIVSDDMEMGGVLTHTGLADAVVRCILAGVHLVEICRDPALIFAAYEALLHEAEISPAFARVLQKAAARVRAFREERLRNPSPVEPPATEAVDRIREAIRQFAVQVEAAAQLRGEKMGISA